MRPGAEAHTDLGEMTGKLTPEDPTHLLRMGSRWGVRRARESSEDPVWALGAGEVRPGSGGGGEGGCVPTKDSVPESQDSGPLGAAGTGRHFEVEDKSDGRKDPQEVCRG